MSFSFNLELFMAIFVEKLSVKNRPNLKLTPYKNGHVLSIFSDQKEVSKCRQMKVNSLKCRFLLI